MSTTAGVSEVSSPRTPLGKFLRKPMNWLLLFIPLTIALEQITVYAIIALMFYLMPQLS